MRDEAGAEGGGEAGAAQRRLLGAEAPRPRPPPQLHGGHRPHSLAGEDAIVSDGASTSQFMVE